MREGRPFSGENRPGLLKKVLLHIAGIGLILLGIVGLFLPVLQGVLMILAGIGLLSMGNERVRIWVRGLGRKYPRVADYFRRIKRSVATRKKSWNHGRRELKQRANDGG